MVVETKDKLHEIALRIVLQKKKKCEKILKDRTALVKTWIR